MSSIVGRYQRAVQRFSQLQSSSLMMSVTSSDFDSLATWTRLCCVYLFAASMYPLWICFGSWRTPSSLESVPRADLRTVVSGREIPSSAL